MLIAAKVRHRRPGGADSRERGRRERVERLRGIDHLAGHHGQQRLDVLNLLFGDGEIVGAEHGKVGVLAGRDAAFDGLLLAQPRAADGEQPQGFFP